MILACYSRIFCYFYLKFGAAVLLYTLNCMVRLLNLGSFSRHCAIIPVCLPLHTVLMNSPYDHHINSLSSTKSLQLKELCLKMMVVGSFKSLTHICYITLVKFQNLIFNFIPCILINEYLLLYQHKHNQFLV